MIKATTTGKDGRPLLILGLSERNIELLQRGQPILIDGRELGLDLDCQIALMAGKDEADILRQLRNAGLGILPGAQRRTI